MGNPIFFPHDRDWNDIINYKADVESRDWKSNHRTKLSIRLLEHKEGNYVLTLLLTQKGKNPEDWNEKVLEFDDCITPEQVGKFLDRPVNLGSFTNAMSFRPSKLGEVLFQRTLEQLLEQGDTRTSLKIVDSDDSEHPLRIELKINNTFTTEVTLPHDVCEAFFRRGGSSLVRRRRRA